MKEDFVGDLDFSTLEHKSFIGDRFKEKESDLIYKVLFKGKPIYLYVLLEFQSTVDNFMALRMLRYEGEWISPDFKGISAALINKEFYSSK